ncbi:MAG: lipopolysaccharide kinase InaA family protein [Lentisphaerota bacterium]
MNNEINQAAEGDKDRVQIGPYEGAWSETFRDDAFLQQFASLPELLNKAAPIQSGGRHALTHLSLPFRGAILDMAIKSFGQQLVSKDWIDQSRGSKAGRSWQIARTLRAHGAGTPEPIGYLNRWEGNRLMESYYVCAYLQGFTSFRDELYRLYREDPLCEKIMRLMARVASGIAAMHQAGVMHNDLGNQNILLKRAGAEDWEDIQFIDLNRARSLESLTLRDRARDISRIDLPSDFLRVFKVMYFGDQNPPSEFERWEHHYRKLFYFHTRTRALRHPFRERRIRAQEKAETIRPPDQDLWIWDDRSAQAIATMTSKDRRRYYPLSNSLRTVKSLVKNAVPIWRHYREMNRLCFQKPVNMAGRIGMSIEPHPLRIEQELKHLSALGSLPVLLRFYRHETPDRRDASVELVRRLAAMGHPVSIALVQDRTAVKDPGLWKSFIQSILPRIHDVIDWVEVGHAINRVKWGLWSFDEYARLLEPIAEIGREIPTLKWIGPAVIDFEYHYLIGMLDRLPDTFHFQALSHHLYVDRRGAPENRQGAFSTREKVALARAIAEWSPRCGKKLILSETNWPIAGTGVWSPVGSPYETPGPRYNDPSVSEQNYSDYMLRYLLIAVCSGHVERVYWWRLAARGFGLIDDTDPENWRLRPAYHALRYFLATLGQSTFQKLIETEDGGRFYIFRAPDGQRHAVAYTTEAPCEVQAPFGFASSCDSAGIPLPGSGTTIRLTGSPIYLLQMES